MRARTVPAIYDVPQKRGVVRILARKRGRRRAEGEVRSTKVIIPSSSVCCLVMHASRASILTPEVPAVMHGGVFFHQGASIKNVRTEEGLKLIQLMNFSILL